MALGTIVLVVGVLILRGFPGLSQLGTTTGQAILVIGACFVLLGTAIKCVKVHSLQNTQDLSENVESKLSNNLFIETARTEAIEWTNQDNKMGVGDYKAAFAETKQIAKRLPTEEIILHYRYFRWGCRFFYGEKKGEKKLIPIFWKDGFIMRWQNNEGASSWPVFDQQKNSYITPKVTVHDIDPPSGSMQSYQYVHLLIEMAEKDQKSDEYRILEALVPYAKSIEKECLCVYELFGEKMGSDYERIRKLIPAYPEVS